MIRFLFQKTNGKGMYKLMIPPLDIKKLHLLAKACGTQRYEKKTAIDFQRGAAGDVDLAIFLDYCSLFQEPRSVLEDEALRGGARICLYKTPSPKKND